MVLLCFRSDKISPSLMQTVHFLNRVDNKARVFPKTSDCHTRSVLLYRLAVGVPSSQLLGYGSNSKNFSQDWLVISKQQQQQQQQQTKP